METKVEQTPETNTNPVLNVDKNGCVLYSNAADNPLLNEWGVEVGEKLPSSIGEIVQRVISRNSPEKTEFKVGNRIYLVVFSPLPEQECVNISGFDISDQKEIEGKHRESENKYRNIVETSVEGIWIFNAVFVTTYVNEKMAEMLGYNREEMIGRFIWDFALKDDMDIFQIKLDNRKRGIDEVYELKLIRKDGSPLLFSVSAKGFFDDTGKFEGSVGMFTDITEHKQAEEALLESNARIESIFRSSPVGIGIVVNRMIMEANERLCEMTGYSREELLGKSALMLYPTAEEYELAGLVKYNMIAESGTGHVETRWQRKDGSVVDILLSSSPIITGDLSGEITFTALDITEHKRTEEALLESEANRKVSEAIEVERQRLYNVLETLPAMICLLTPDYRIVFSNRSFREKFGISVGRHCYKSRFGRTEPCEFCESYKVFETGQARNWKVTTPDGSVIDTYDLPFTDFDGTPMILKMDIDITGRKKAEEALANIEIARQKEIHHRIKNNLQVISSLLDLQADKFNNREYIKCSEVLEA